MEARAVYFTAPESVELRSKSVSTPQSDELRVEAAYSAISAGTEKLLYEGNAPSQIDAADPVETLFEDLSYPTQYGYAAAGTVTHAGDDLDDDWIGRRVFAYNPHETVFTASVDRVVPVPAGLSIRHAPLLANVETAVNLLLDGAPVIGERVAVFGQGVVGLLTTALLAETPVEQVVAVDPIERRRSLAAELGADVTVDPRDNSPGDLFGTEYPRPDLVYELSGAPEAFDAATAVAAYDGRIVVGSWYGNNPAPMSVDDRFHRHRLSIESSQVGTIDPQHQGRWSRERRHTVAWRWLEKIPVDAILTHELAFDRAPAAYQLLADEPEKAVQVLLCYD